MRYYNLIEKYGSSYCAYEVLQYAVAIYFGVTLKFSEYDLY